MRYQGLRCADGPSTPTDAVKAASVFVHRRKSANDKLVVFRETGERYVGKMARRAGR